MSMASRSVGRIVNKLACATVGLAIVLPAAAEQATDAACAGTRTGAAANAQTAAAGCERGPAVQKNDQPANPPDARCGALMAVDVDLQSYYDKPGRTYRTELMKRGEAYVMSFVTGPESEGINLVAVQEALGDRIPRFVNISKERCDFTVPRNYNRRGTTTLKYFVIGKPNKTHQVLEPNTRYYINIKNEDVAAYPGIDTCAADKICGFVLTFFRTAN